MRHRKRRKEGEGLLEEANLRLISPRLFCTLLHPPAPRPLRATDSADAYTITALSAETCHFGGRINSSFYRSYHNHGLRELLLLGQPKEPMFSALTDHDSRSLVCRDVV
jgi:hypothetical protein